MTMHSNLDINTRIAQVLEFFPVSSMQSVQLVTGGLITSTYRVRTAEGDFCLQKVHRDIPDAAMEDMRTVTEHLAARGFSVPQLIRTRDGALFIRDKENSRWRLYRWVSGTVHNEMQNGRAAYEAGKFLGQLHRALAELNYKPKGTIPHFHDTPYIVSKLAGLQGRIPEAVRAMPENTAESFADDLNILIEKLLAEMPRLLLADDIAGAPQIIHGDPKAANLLWDDTGNVIGILDCDTFLWHYPAIDMGDALRSWCKHSGHFNLEIYSAATDGYAKGAGKPLTAEHHALYIRATKQITLELTCRFLIDVSEDSYFGWDATLYPSRRMHNLARAQQYHSFFATIPESA